MDRHHLPLIEEPTALRDEMYALLAQDPARGRARIEQGDWISGRLWDAWRPALEPRGLDEVWLRRVVAGYANELRLWLVGERTWRHCIEGLAGRTARRSTVPINRETIPP